MSGLTIKDIAAKADVSVTTVSRVLNGGGKVSEKNRTRVKEVIEETGFVPSITARSLKSKKSYTVGLVVSDISDRYYSLMTKSIADALADEDYSLIVFCTDNNKTKEQSFFEFLSAKNVDGIILNTVGGLDAEICALSKKIPMVLVNRKLMQKNDNIGFDFVGTDDVNGAYLLTKYLLCNGHRDIAIINGPTSVSSGFERNKGFIMAMKDFNIEVSENYPFCYNKDFDIATGSSGADYLLNLPKKPTAIISMNDSITIGVMQYCQRHVIRIPEDLSLVAYGDVDNSELFAIRPKCLTLSPDTIGRKAVSCLLDRMNNKSIPIKEVIFSSSLDDGKSVFPRR